MTRACRDSRNDLASKLHPPRMRGVSQYTGWASQLRKEVAQVRDADARRFLESCRRMLEVKTALLVQCNAPVKPHSLGHRLR